MWTKLTDATASLAKAYESLLSIAKEKRGALVAVDMKALAQAVQREEKALEVIRSREAARQAALIALADAEPNVSRSMSMTDLRLACPREVRARFTEANRALSKAVEAAREAGEANEFLARTALGAVEYHLNRIGGAAVDPAYGSSGRETVSRQQNFSYDA